jgi:hypothetical protein
VVAKAVDLRLPTLADHADTLDEENARTVARAPVADERGRNLGPLDGVGHVAAVLHHAAVATAR